MSTCYSIFTKIFHSAACGIHQCVTDNFNLFVLVFWDFHTRDAIIQRQIWLEPYQFNLQLPAIPVQIVQGKTQHNCQLCISQKAFLSKFSHRTGSLRENPYIKCKKGKLSK